ncbi:uncharacterized protein LOC124343727 [Daphnia pulicaria]|uniref:uncharacterized protein LOC124343727 n=1 Tax=Daphnia pulicaria TaxID=35523 RepID=UPI001EEBB578|nr:uncharacterized protein LOC124343727 [Daphnia pulicaria]
MSRWFSKLFLVVVLTALGKPESEAEDNADGLQTIEGSAGWDSTECQQLQDRLEALESAVKSIVSALASQKNEIFAPITAILEQNAALRVILSSPLVSQGVTENSTIHPDFSYNTTINTNNETDKEEFSLSNLTRHIFSLAVSYANLYLIALYFLNHFLFVSVQWLNFSVT